VRAEGRGTEAPRLGIHVGIGATRRSAAAIPHLSLLAGFAGTAPRFQVAEEDAKEGKENRARNEDEELLHEPLSRPAKPMKAMDRLPAMIITRPVPLAILGMSESSDVSRMEAINTSARVSPNPAPMA